MYYHLNHDISLSYLRAKVICLSIFWGATIRCYCNTHFSSPPNMLFMLPPHDIHRSSWHSFLPPSSSVSPSGNVPAPLANRIRSPSWFLYLVLLKQPTTLSSFEAAHISNPALYTLHPSDLYNNLYRKEANRDSSPLIHVLLYLLNICWIPSENGSVN